MLVVPLPSRDLGTTLIGPQFRVSKPSGGPVIQIGDGFVVAGLALRHVPSGFELDVGGLMFYGIAEAASHRGVDGARVLHVAWRPSHD